MTEHDCSSQFSTDPHSKRRRQNGVRFSLSLLWLTGFALIALIPHTASSSSSSASFPGQALMADSTTITATLTLTNTVTITPTQNITSTVTFTPTYSPTQTSTPLPSATPQAPFFIPVLRMSEIRSTEPPPPPNYSLICDSLPDPRSIPDNNPAGIIDTINIGTTGYISSIAAYIDINHTWTGDLSLTLTHQDTNHTIVLLDRPGVPASGQGCQGDNLQVLFDDRAAQTAEDKCAPSLLYNSGNAISGTFQPQDPFAAFVAEAAQGSWSLKVADLYKDDEGTLNHWCLEIATVDAPPSPSPTPTGVPLPPSAYVGGMSGQPQQYPLDCESRAAVDWASHFGMYINELEFFYRLPVSDNPDRGFVGNVLGTWGYIPPNDYGVHAQPIADLLRSYGLPAVAARSLSFDELRAEIANDSPVMVWITGKTDYGAPQFYIPRDGIFTIVARYEHTVNVIGYDESNVTILDGGSIYTRSVSHFLDSWSALRFMAVLAGP